MADESAQLPYEGVDLRPRDFEPNPAYATLASMLLDADGTSEGDLLAVQWRSEDWQHNDKGKPIVSSHVARIGGTPRWKMIKAQKLSPTTVTCMNLLRTPSELLHRPRSTVRIC